MFIKIDVEEPNCHKFCLRSGSFAMQFPATSAFYNDTDLAPLVSDQDHYLETG